MLSRGVCCLAHSNCVPYPSDVVVTHEISTFPFVPASCGSTTLRHPSNHSVLIVRSRRWEFRVLLSLIELKLELNPLSHGSGLNRQHSTRASSSTSDQPLLTNSHRRSPHPILQPSASPNYSPAQDNMAEIAAGALAVEQVVSTGIQAGAAVAVAKPAQPFKASLNRIATSPAEDTSYVIPVILVLIATICSSIR